MATPVGERDVALQRTPEIRETESGNVEVRKDPDHTSKLPKPAEKVLGPGTPEPVQEDCEAEEKEKEKEKEKMQGPGTPKPVQEDCEAEEKEKESGDGDGVARSPFDILAVRRIVEDTDTPLE